MRVPKPSHRHPVREPRPNKAAFDAMTEAQKRDYLAQQKARRARRITPRGRKILEIVKDGFHVEQISESHFLVNGRLDLYPIHNRWRDRKRNLTGSAKNLAVFAKEWRKQ